MKGSNTPHSIRQRLLNYVQAHRENFDLVLLRYANERLLYRLRRFSSDHHWPVLGDR